MAQQTKVELTKSKLELEGVQVTFKVQIGDWRYQYMISPVDYAVFARWDKIYAQKVITNILRQIEYELATPPNKKEEV